jgi:hypothetical protein
MLVLVGLLVFVYHLGTGIYTYNNLQPLPTWDFLYQGAFLSGVVWALKADTRKSAVQSVYCSGLIFSIGWLFAAPYHLLKTRGAVGLIPILALMGCLVAAPDIYSHLMFTIGDRSRDPQKSRSRKKYTPAPAYCSLLLLYGLQP